MSVRENLIFLLDQSRMNPTSLARAIGIPQPTIYRIKTGETKSPSVDVLQPIASYYGLTVDDLVNKDLRMDDRVQRRGNVVIQREAGSRRVPLIRYSDVTVAVRKGGPVDRATVMGSLLTDLQHSDGAFAVDLIDDSMAPEFQRGDRIVADPEVKPMPGDYVLAADDADQPVFGKYRPRQDGTFELVAMNPDYPTLHLAGTQVLATMVEHRRYRRR